MDTTQDTTNGAAAQVPPDAHAYLAARILAGAAAGASLARAKRHYAATVLRVNAARDSVYTLGLPSDRALAQVQRRYRRLLAHASVAHLRLLDLITARYGPPGGA